MTARVSATPATPRLALWQWIVLFVASAAATYVILLLAIPIRSAGRSVAQSNNASGERQQGGSKASSDDTTPDTGKSASQSSRGKSASGSSTLQQPGTSTVPKPNSNDDTPEPPKSTDEVPATAADTNPASGANPVPDVIPVAPDDGLPEDPPPADTPRTKNPDRPAVARDPLPPLKNVEEVQRMINERAKAGQFGNPTDWKKAAEFANAEVQRRHDDGRLSQGTQIQFQALPGGISVSVSARSGGQRP